MLLSDSSLPLFLLFYQFFLFFFWPIPIHAIVLDWASCLLTLLWDPHVAFLTLSWKLVNSISGMPRTQCSHRPWKLTCFDDFCLMEIKMNDCAWWLTRSGWQSCHLNLSCALQVLLGLEGILLGELQSQLHMLIFPNSNT